MNRVLIDKLAYQGTFNGILLDAKVIETHISWVLLTKKYAFKIKKPMQYSFLDYSTIAKRKFYCDRELELNKKYSKIYLDVVPIWSNKQALMIGRGHGVKIGYAVHMKKMLAGKKMDVCLRNKRVTFDDMDRLAHTIADFHHCADIIRLPFFKKRQQASFNDIKIIRDLIISFLDKSYVALMEEAIDFSDSFLERNQSLIERRVAQGFKRDVHGDLHAKNIFLYKSPVIFDCIEFNDEFRQIDVLNEIAFFCMDLESFKRFDLSKYFIKGYLELFPCLGSKAEWQLFNYYKCYRANVRAKVGGLRARQEKDEKKIKIHIHQIEKYLNLMSFYINQSNETADL